MSLHAREHRHCQAIASASRCAGARPECCSCRAVSRWISLPFGPRLNGTPPPRHRPPIHLPSGAANLPCLRMKSRSAASAKGSSPRVRRPCSVSGRSTRMWHSSARRRARTKIDSESRSSARPGNSSRASSTARASSAKRSTSSTRSSAGRRGIARRRPRSARTAGRSSIGSSTSSGPKHLVALGGTAAKNLLETINRHHATYAARSTTIRGVPLICTFHPSALLRDDSGSMKRDVWEDMKLLLRTMGRPIPEVKKG